MLNVDWLPEGREKLVPEVKDNPLNRALWYCTPFPKNIAAPPVLKGSAKIVMPASSGPSPEGAELTQKLHAIEPVPTIENPFPENWKLTRPATSPCGSAVTVAEP